MVRNVQFSTEEAMNQTEEWLAHLRGMGRKDSTIRTHRNNVRRCLNVLAEGGRSPLAEDITEADVLFLWRTLPVREGVKRSYLRSLSDMVCFHTGRDVVRSTNLLYNRECRDRLFITDQQFRAACAQADPLQAVILHLGAFMGLRRAEMSVIRDSDMRDGRLIVYGKGHGDDGLVVEMEMPAPVIDAISAYESSEMKAGIRLDDRLLQCRDHRGRLHGMDPSRISDSVCTLGKTCGFRLTTHSLRRYFATTLYYKTGSDLQTLKSLLRHSDISTTLKCYVDVYDEKEREATRTLTEFLQDLLCDSRKKD